MIKNEQTKDEGNQSSYSILKSIQTGGLIDAQLISKQGKLLLREYLDIDNVATELSRYELFARECQALALLEHSSLPRIVETSMGDSVLELLMDYEESTSLFKYIYPKALEDNGSPEGVPELPNLEQVRRWALQISECIAFIHKQKPFPVLHRNLSTLR